jgi:transposase
MLNMGQQYTILTLHKQGKTNAEIARALHCNRHTVENVLKRREVIEKQTRHKPSAVTPYKEKIKEWLIAEICRQMKISRMTFYRYVKPTEKQPPGLAGFVRRIRGLGEG